MMIEMTTKRKPPIVTVASHFWIAVKAVVFVSFFICFIVSFLYLSTMSVVVDDSPSSYLSSSYDYSLDFPGRIAFMFLVRSNVPLDFLWHTFFKNGDVEKFSIYIHSAQRLSFNQSTTRSHYFYNRQLKRTVDVVWGEVSMIEAEKLLLSTALNDLSNQRFILLSDSCVPLHNFTYIYNYVMSSSKSFVDSFGDEKDKRYSRKMSPVISKAKWRKGSQWFTLTRKHATAIAADSSILRIFQKHCKCVHCQVDPAIPKKSNFFFQEPHDCIPDEHYMQTFFSTNALEDELERRTLTFTAWNQSNDKTNKQAWHPFRFGFSDAIPQRILEIKNVNHVYYKTEFRTEWCKSNSTMMPCFLFARKFSKGGAMRLLNQGSVGPFETTDLLSTFLK